MSDGFTDAMRGTYFGDKSKKEKYEINIEISGEIKTGKSTIANIIRQALEKEGFEVNIDETLNISEKRILAIREISKIKISERTIVSKKSDNFTSFYGC
jgi:nucleoside-triphosphatase THEP1